LEAPEHAGLGIEALDGGRQRRSALVGVEVPGERKHRRVVERGLSMQVSARGEDKERAADRGVQLLLYDRNLLPGHVGEDDELDVGVPVTRRWDTRLRSSRA